MPYLFKGTSNERGEAFQNLNFFFFEEFIQPLDVAFFVYDSSHF
jgi:hypothetical protein